MRLYLTRPRELARHFAAGLAMIAPCRRALALRAPRPEEALRRLATGLLLRRVLGVTRDTDLTFGPHGKPALSRGGPCFSLSYAGEYALLSVARAPHGADMEAVVPIPPALAHRCLAPEELALWRAAPDPDDLFCRFWTGKESLMKATGLGFRLAPDRVRLLPPERTAIALGGVSWFVRGLAWDGCRIAVARPGPEPLEPSKPTLLPGLELLEPPRPTVARPTLSPDATPCPRMRHPPF